MWDKVDLGKTCPGSRPHGGALRRVLWLRTIGAAALLAVVLAGCGREDPHSVSARPETTAGTELEAFPAPSVRTTQQYVLVAKVESGLDKLKGIAIDDQDRIYVAGADGVRVLSPEGKPLTGWRTPEAARCVATDSEGNVYVGLRTKVEKYDGNGKRLASWGKAGKGRGEFGVVTAIVLSGVNVFVADAGNRCVHRFDVTGDFIDEIGKRDLEAGVLGLICPSPYLGCAVGEGGVLHVTNPGRLRVEQYRLNGELIGFWGEAGMEAEQFAGCCNPISIAMMADGSAVTAEKGIPRVKVYGGDGKMLAHMGPEFFSPGIAGLDVAVDSKGRVYVADPGDGNVRVFAPEQ